MECEEKQIPMCRLCLRNKKSMLNIFTCFNLSDECALKLAIEDLLNVKISQSDGLPQTVCGDCCSKVLGYKSFKAMCLKSREILWRKAQEKLIMGDFPFNEARELLHQKISNSNRPKYMEEGSPSLTYSDIKKEICEDVQEEISDSGFHQDDTQNHEVNTIITHNQYVQDSGDIDNLSTVSTIVRDDEMDPDAESLHLRLQSSSSECSDYSQPQEEENSDMEISYIKKEPMDWSHFYGIKECRVVLTRCNVERFNVRENERQTEKRNPSTVKPTAQSQEEAGPKFTVGSTYQCSDCWITFSSPTFLRNHKRYHHGINLKPLDISTHNESTNGMNDDEYGQTLDVVGASQSKKKSKVTLKDTRGGVVPKGMRSQSLAKKDSNPCDPEKRVSPNEGDLMKDGHPAWIQKNTKLLVERTVNEMPLKKGKSREKTSMKIKGESDHISVNEGDMRKERGGRMVYDCKHCPKIFKSSYNLKVHTYVHDGTKPFCCHMCSDTFRTKEQKQRHISLHLNEKPYVCHICSKSYRIIGSLRRHLVSHSTSRPYKCEHCNKAFKSIGSIKGHMRVHTGERPFKCKLCPQAFALKGNLIAHAKIHSGVCPYECKVCGNRFVSTTGLKRHMKRHSDSANPMPEGGC